MRHRMLLAACAAVIAIPVVAAAQAPAGHLGDTVLVRGAQVRVMREMNGWRRQETRGSLIRYANDTAVVQVTFDSIAVIRLDADRAIEVRTVHKSRTLQGMGIGSLVGATGGALLGAATYQKCTNCFDFGIGVNIAAGAAVGSLGGAVIGALIGSAAGEDTWSAVQRSHAPRAGVRPSPGGGVTVSLGFSF